jgi:hypothetical protein
METRSLYDRLDKPTYLQSKSIIINSLERVCGVSHSPNREGFSTRSAAGGFPIVSIYNYWLQFSTQQGNLVCVFASLF